ncbi:MAG: SDR family NAD(P)-dependent oxidoreductase [Chloroflexi bacterium]|nr:SDR family NAD(P)-dependent oxidoreductase [Chloroflexota bacterium]MYF22488.1 SDR family NAD(P)-dependent oxidoreductase [Chloroflexota bacterium]
MVNRALVTGANGFIGAHVVRAALGAGAEVRAMVRQGSDQRSLAGLPVEIVHGDLTNTSSIEHALAGIDTLFNVAARYDLSRRARRDAYRVNVDGTRQLMRAALRAQVDRVVHTSSVAAVGPPIDPSRPADERQWAQVKGAPGPYEETKILSERLVHELVADDSLPAVCVLPTAPIGPLDFKPTPTGRLIRDAAIGAMPAFIRSAGLNVVHVRDVAIGHVNAANMGRVGERYILGHQDGNLALREIIERAALSGDTSPPRIPLPSTVAFAAALIDEFLLSALTRQQPRATIAGVRLARQRQYFDCQKAIEELQLPQTDLDETFNEAAAWFQKDSP